MRWNVRHEAESSQTMKSDTLVRRDTTSDDRLRAVETLGYDDSNMQAELRLWIETGDESHIRGRTVFSLIAAAFAAVREETERAMRELCEECAHTHAQHSPFEAGECTVYDCYCNGFEQRKPE